MADSTFTFTDAQLQSLLSCIDEGTFEVGGGGNTQFLPAAAGMQFLPPPEQPAGAVFVPTNLSDPQPLGGSLHQAPLPLPPPSAPKQHTRPQGGAGNGDDPFALGRAPRHVHVHQPPQQQQQQRRQQPTQQRLPQRAAATAAQASAAVSAGRASAAAVATSAAKQPHSMVEKQRRDRINTLIDELRELVPPQAGEPAEALQEGPGGDSRRPKHTVLSDTIRLIKDLQLQLAGSSQAPQPPPAAAVGEAGASFRAWGQGQHSVTAPPAFPGHRHQPEAPQQAQQQQQAQQAQPPQQAGGPSPRHSGEGWHPELPLAPDDAAVTGSGVLVETVEGEIKYVKVTCPDRHGLLADVVRALRELPLEITTAAITTRRDHVVYDVFQVEVEDPALQPEQIRCAVESVLFLSTSGDKKRRQDASL